MQRFRAARQAAVAILLGLTVSLTITPGPGRAVTTAARADEGWTGSWSVAHEGAGGTLPARSTTRQIVHTSIGGTEARLRLSNVFTTKPLTLTDFHLAQRASGADIVASTSRPVTFGGQTSVTIAAGGQAVSDPVTFEVRPQSDVAVSFFAPTGAEGVSSHQFGFQDRYLADGNVTGAGSLSVRQTLGSYLLISDLEVRNPAATGAVVTLGASITEGHSSSSNRNLRYPNLLAARLNASGRTVGVLNEGIAGNQLLGVGIGPSALDRFDRDVLGRSGVRSVIFADNPINDLGSGREPTGAQLVAGLQQLIGRAHNAGIAFFCATLTPFEGAGGWTAGREVVRGQYNAYVRGSASGCDAVVDFDVATHDPAAPSKFLPAFDSGDHLHPNDAGMQAMADAVPLELFGHSVPTANLARGAVATASSTHPDFPAGRAVNGLWAPGYEGWVSQVGKPQSIILDLGSARTIGRYVLRHDGAARPAETEYNTRDFEVRTSTDGVTWQTADSVRDNVLSITDRAVAAVSARYVQLTVSEPNQGRTVDSITAPRARIGQIELYAPAG